MINKTKGKNGYALLFAVVITSIISIIIAGLSNLVYKQLILTSMVKDSQSAFYMADTATECALYAHFIKSDDLGGNSWNCGVEDFDSGSLFSLVVGDKYGNNSYEVTAPSALNTSANPCFEFNIDKETSNKVAIKSRGFNMCNKNNFRTVQREIEVNYQL